MSQRTFTRRRFLKSSGAAASVALLGPSLFELGCGTSLYTRRDVGGLDASSPIIQSYSKAVKAMQLLPATDPRSWSYQAAIHGTYTTPVQTAWNTCEHGSDHFWSWHRPSAYYARLISDLI